MTQTITPYLPYEDAAAALEFLSQAFGFKETMRSPSSDGGVAHAEMERGEGRIMLGQPGHGYRDPARLGATTVLMYAYVDDIDAHCARTRDAGGEIVEPPADQEYGDRRYHARDPEGHDRFIAETLARDG